MDTALAISVMNYLPEPARMVGEAWRVLRPGGILIAEFTQMRPHDPALHDYFRYTREGAAWLLEHAGFEVLETHPIGGLMARVGLSAIAALNRINRGPTRVITELPVRLLYLVIQVTFELLDRLLSDPRECLGTVVVARKPGRAPEAETRGRASRGGPPGRVAPIPLPAYWPEVGTQRISSVWPYPLML